MKLFSVPIVCLLLVATIGASVASPTDLAAKLAQLRLDPDYDEAFNEIIAEPKKKIYVMPYEFMEKLKQVKRGQNAIPKNEKDWTTTTNPPKVALGEVSTEATVETEVVVNQEDDGFLAAHSRVRSIVLAMTSLMRNFFNRMT